MPKPERTMVPTAAAGLQWQITDDGSRTLWDERLNETYHSGCGAVVESLVVYLRNSGVLKRLRAGQPTSVLEYGLGTGTAFLLTAAAAEIYQVPLRYRALEQAVLPAAVLAELQLDHCQLELLEPTYASEFAELVSVAQQLLQSFVRWRSELSTDLPVGDFCGAISPYVELEVVVGDASNYRVVECDCFDAVYFDPFSPATCPQLWTRDVYQVAHQCLRAGGTLTSYCVKSEVRRDLAAVGFVVERLAGPVGGKREVLLATKPFEPPRDRM